MPQVQQMKGLRRNDDAMKRLAGIIILFRLIFAVYIIILILTILLNPGLDSYLLQLTFADFTSLELVPI